jgi:hypothetical protein
MLSLSLSLFYYTGNVGRSGQADRFFGHYGLKKQQPSIANSFMNETEVLLLIGREAHARSAALPEIAIACPSPPE